MLDVTIGCSIEPVAMSPAQRYAWARLIQKIYGVDPLTRPQCKGVMKIIRVIDHPKAVQPIVHHLGLREMQKRPPPKINSPPSDYYYHEHIPPYDRADLKCLFEGNILIIGIQNFEPLRNRNGQAAHKRSLSG